MSQRLLAFSAIVLFVTVSLAGQAQPTQKWTPPRTADGQPDLQGFWTNSTYTPLERPKGMTKEFYTPEEAAESKNAPPQKKPSRPSPARSRTCTTTSRQFGLDRSQAGSREPAHLTDRRSGRRETPAAVGRGTEASSRTRRGGEARRPLGLGGEQPARRPLHHHRRRGPPMLYADLQRQLSHRAGARLCDDSRSR